MIYNGIEISREPLSFIQGDDVGFTVEVQTYDPITLIYTDYDLSGKDLRWVLVNKHGTIIADWSTAGGELTIAVNLLNVSADAINAVSCCGSFDGQLKELTPDLTIWKGIAKIEGGLF
jgi:hypothetical protein